MMYQENHLSQLEFQSPSGTLKSFWLIRVSSNLCTRTQHTNRFQEKIMSQLQPHPHTINHINYFIQSGSNSQTEVSGTPKDAYLNSQRQGEETVFNNVDLYQCCFFLVLQFKNLWCSHCVQWRGFLFLLFFADFGMSAEVTEHGVPVSSKYTVPLTVYSCPLLSSGRGPRTMPRWLLNISKDRDAISRGT